MKMEQEPIEEPLFLGLLYDASGSMAVYRDQVLKHQPDLISALRGTQKCRRKALFVYQGLFSRTPVQLDQFTQVDQGGRDGLTTLTPANYQPSGPTALYAALEQMLGDLEDAIDNMRAARMSASCSIAVITDGQNTEAPKDSAVVRRKIEQLRDKDMRIMSSLVIGLPSPELDQARVDSIRAELGFSVGVLAGKSDREIRRAFLLPSQPNVVS